MDPGLEGGRLVEAAEPVLRVRRCLPPYSGDKLTSLLLIRLHPPSAHQLPVTLKPLVYALGLGRNPVCLHSCDAAPDTRSLRHNSGGQGANKQSLLQTSGSGGGVLHRVADVGCPNYKVS